jgi:hypothetical protein
MAEVQGLHEQILAVCIRLILRKIQTALNKKGR